MTFAFPRRKTRKEVNVMPHTLSVRRKPGDIFSSITGKAVADCQTIDDVDAAVGIALHIKGHLLFDDSESGFVVRSGDVFPHLAANLEADIDRKIDEALSAA